MSNHIFIDCEGTSNILWLHVESRLVGEKPSVHKI